MGAIATHSAPEKVADGTCTRVWTWMTDKCRKKMNGGVGYITTEISQKEETQEKERGPWDAREVGDSSPRARGPFSLEPWAARSWAFFPPQNEPLPYQSPTSRPTLYKFIVMGPVWKPWPHNIIFNLTNNHDCWNYLRKKVKIVEIFLQKCQDVDIVGNCKSVYWISLKSTCFFTTSLCTIF